MTNYTNEWDLYQKGIEYKTRLGLYKTVEENHRFFQGDQWHGVKSEGLPTPVFNVIKPVLRYKISTLMQNNLSIIYNCLNYGEKDFEKLEKTAGLLTTYSSQLWEKLKMEHYSEEVLKDGAVSGDGLLYFYYDDETKSLKMEVIDNTNIYPQNPNNPNIQEQEYLIIAFRRSVDSVRDEALSYGVLKEEAERITSDNETEYCAGDVIKLNDDQHQCTVLLKLWKDKETKTVHFKKSTRDVVITDDCDTGLKLYPVAMFNWESRKNSFHGVSDVTSLIPNQIYINKIAAMVMLSTMYTAFPKMVYDENLVDNPSNQIGVAIGVNGSDKPISSIIDYITPASVSNDAFSMFERTITLTKDLMGANDGALGSINPEKASGTAIMTVMEQSAKPLESIKRRFYNFIEDVALIWADMIRTYIKNDLTVVCEGVDGKKTYEKLDGKMVEKLIVSAKIDVGPANKWSEISTMSTLDNLLNGRHIPFDWYVELLPENCGIPKEKVLQLLKKHKETTGETQPDVVAGMTAEEKGLALKNPKLLFEKLETMKGAKK